MKTPLSMFFAISTNKVIDMKRKILNESGNTKNIILVYKKCQNNICNTFAAVFLYSYGKKWWLSVCKQNLKKIHVLQ